jgi:hypothetical protein
MIAADDWMTGQEIRNPDRMASLYAVGGSWCRADAAAIDS